MKIESEFLQVLTPPTAFISSGNPDPPSSEDGSLARFEAIARESR